MISRAPGLKLVVETLITSLKPIGNIVLICCAFFIIFGILGVQVSKEKCPKMTFDATVLPSLSEGGLFRLVVCLFISSQTVPHLARGRFKGSFLCFD